MRRRNTEPSNSIERFKELILWIIPSVVIAVMIAVTWKATHALDPYRPLVSDVKPLTIQVVALDWKWLFIYPEQGIATVNFVQFPDRHADPLELVSRWLSDELLLDSAAKRANLRDDGHDDAAAHHGRWARRVYRQSGGDQWGGLCGYDLYRKIDIAG